MVDFNRKTDIVFFLAGPIKGAGDWQKSAIKMLQKFAATVPVKRSVYVVCPSVYQPNHELYSLKVDGIAEEKYTKKQRKVIDSQTSWERRYLELASRLGCIIFWLAQEDEKNPRKREEGPYARDTYGELGEWRARMYYEWKYNKTRINLVIGGHHDFHGLAQIARNYKQMVGNDFKISTTLPDLIKRATIISRRASRKTTA